ncbi:hypothetical protein ACQP2F_44590 [Actinoplanes sp. CA-030573]|uniref:hypothetical protein n=1 Tax=Actinoplanes sp. CA-030573 TaxID=3239898 RepID=UPI003D9080C8
MQPQEPASAGAPPPAPPLTTAPKRRPNRPRLILAILAGVMAILCLGGAGVVFLVYDQATKVDRSEPDVVTDSFLIAYLVNRDDKAAALFTCRDPDLAEISALRDQLVAREKQFNVKVSVSWGALTRQPVTTGQEDVTTQLTISGSANGQISSSRNEDWRFRVVSQDGSWRLCSGTKIG